MQAHDDFADRAIAAWAAKRPDLDVTPIAAAVRINRIAKLQDTAVRAVLTAHGLAQSSEYDTLAFLRRADGPCSPTTMAASLLVTTAAMTGRLDRLQERGLIVRLAHPDDRRAQRIEITPHGRQVFDAAQAAVIDTYRTAWAPLSETQRRRLADLLRPVLNGLDPPAAEPDR